MNRPAKLLLRHRRLVAPALLAADPAPDFADPAPGGWRGRRVIATPGSADDPQTPEAGPREIISAPGAADGLRALEADLLRLGYLPSASLRHRLAELTGAELANVGRHLLQALLAELGGHVDHVPLFRRFPVSVPADTFEFYVRRVFTLLLQEPEQPCVLCGKVGTVHAVSPCAHLVCRACWDGSDFSACPTCHRRIDLDDPFLRPIPDLPTETETEDGPRPKRVTLLSLCDDPAEGARDLLRTLLARQTPLRPEDRVAVSALVEDFWPRSADWLPERIPVRETRALVLAAAVPRGAHELLDRHADSATDVLRLLYALMDGDPGLRERPARRVSPGRAVRRALLARLDRLPLPQLVEDLHRHPAAWKHMAEVLHPFERYRSHPDAALAFAALRGTRLDTGTPLAGLLLERAARHPEVFRFDGVRLRPLTFATRVEAALRDGDHAGALDLLERRPGELIRRLAHLARHVPAERLATAVAEAAPEVSPGVLLAALGQLRTPPGGTRMFLPRGGSARVWTEPDARPAVPARTVSAVWAALTAEMLRRAASLPRVERAVLDADLADLLAPAAERSASSALVRLPRGSVRPIPPGERIRLFLHWAQPEDVEIDLDLSLALFDEHWQFTGRCDYTNLRLGDDAAVHSGDLTSAPEPLGASEFIDLDVPKLRALGGRYAVPIVFSYNDVSFDQLARGFAGFLDSPGGLFDPLAVRQRFDLASPAKILVPLVADLWSRTMRWADLNLSAIEALLYHNVYAYEAQLARLGAALEDVYGLGDRVTLWEVACWHAAARSAEVLVRLRDGTVSRYLRGPAEEVGDFHARLAALAVPDGTRDDLGSTDFAAAVEGDLGGVDFAAVIEGDLEPAGGAQVYALHPGHLDPAGVRMLDAADLVAQLAPTASPEVTMDGAMRRLLSCDRPA
ncbi:MXAN_6230/SCO0854 family RING domain-containing protein [Streptosporangium sp. NPDC000396]|uniref:MXAN_6230/SCO0854 family RING domain-containing protein n=1 Tax=Streptosporangium sp. NPDC000396 TaxID=3366185 RepID=UPI0036CE39EC